MSKCGYHRPRYEDGHTILTSGGPSSCQFESAETSQGRAIQELHRVLHENPFKPADRHIALAALLALSVTEDIGKDWNPDFP